MDERNNTRTTMKTVTTATYTNPETGWQERVEVLGIPGTLDTHREIRNTHGQTARVPAWRLSDQRTNKADR